MLFNKQTHMLTKANIPDLFKLGSYMNLTFVVD